MLSPLFSIRLTRRWLSCLSRAQEAARAVGGSLQRPPQHVMSWSPSNFVISID